MGHDRIPTDIDAVDENGVEFYVEVQRNTKGSHIRRPRFHQSMMDSRLQRTKRHLCYFYLSA